MLVKTLLKNCETGFGQVIIADSTSGHTMEFSSVKDAHIVAGGDRILSWEVGVITDIDNENVSLMMVLLITV